jgi:hypothetical protein
MNHMIRIILPQHLQSLAGAPREVRVDVPAPVTQSSILTALETRYPTLRGAIRGRATGRRRPMVRFFACEEDVSHESPDALLPEKVAAGVEPFYIIGAIAGG